MPQPAALRTISSLPLRGVRSTLQASSGPRTGLEGACVMRRIRWIPVALALLAFALPVCAEEILYLKSGSAMPVVSHTVDGDMIHVDLGDNAFMAFPLTMVDRVERAGENVMLRRSNSGGTNVMTPKPDPTGSFPVRGSAQSRKSDKRRFEEESRADGSVEMDSSGVQVYRPYGNSSHPGKRKVGLAWDERVLQNSGAGYRGATPVGNRHVIGSMVPRRRTEDTTAPKITGIEFRPSGPRNNPGPRTEERDSQSDSNDSDSEE